jgi:hypothetical protein
MLLEYDGCCFVLLRGIPVKGSTSINGINLFDPLIYQPRALSPTLTGGR